MHYTTSLVVLLRIPNPQPNLRIFCGRKWRFWVICSLVNIYFISSGGVQATLRNSGCRLPLSSYRRP